MNTLYKIVASVCSLALVPAPLMAQQDDMLSQTATPAAPVVLSGDVMVVKTIVDDTGAERTELVKPDLIVPGDRLLFGTEYANNGGEAVTNFVVTNPLPAAVRLAPDSDPALVVSVDGGASWGQLSALTVKAEDGSDRSASHADVTHVRWTLALIEPGMSGRLEYPAIIR